MAEKENNGIIRLLIIAVSIVIVLSIIGYFMMSYVNPQTEQVKPEDVENTNKEIGPIYELGDFTVNFQNEQSFQFLKASIVLEMNKKDLKVELKKRNPQIRDLIITVLRSQKLEDIKSPSTDKIKNQIINTLNNNLNKGEITNVWFTQLVIQ